jgi:hypothetical protein
MFAIGSFMAVEVSLSAFNQFKRYRGLYFWSIQVAAWGIVVHSVTAQLRYLQIGSNLSMAIPFVLGWWCMVQVCTVPPSNINPSPELHSA